MLKKEITFTDYEGNARTKEYWFNLNKAEIIKWLTTNGDYTLDKALERIAKERNGRKIMETFDELIQMSIGEISLDGIRFQKSEDIKRAFVESEAYSVLFMELVTDAKKAAAFVNGILPSDLSDEIQKIMKDNPEGIPDELRDYLPDDSKVVMMATT